MGSPKFKEKRREISREATRDFVMLCSKKWIGYFARNVRNLVVGRRELTESDLLSFLMRSIASRKCYFHSSLHAIDIRAMSHVQRNYYQCKPI